MSTGTGIAIAMMMYLVAQAVFFLIGRLDQKAARRPAATEARIERIEKYMREIMGADL